MIKDHFGTILRVFSNHQEMGLAIEAEILTGKRFIPIQSNCTGRFCHNNILGDR